MPVILRVEGFKFFFYSNEGVPPEPTHIHVRKGGLEILVNISNTVGPQ